jgi:hypothetical protein
MPKIQWISIYHSNNSVLAELLRDILTENQIPCYLSQEAVGKEIYPVTIGKLSEIDLLVPIELANSAQEMIQAYLSETTQDNTSPGPDSNADFDLDQ